MTIDVNATGAASSKRPDMQRRLITLHIGRGLCLYRPRWRLASVLDFVLFHGRGPVHLVDLPGAPRVALQIEGLHPLDADALARSLVARGQAQIATNDATIINAVALACAEGELRVVAHAWGDPTPWDVDQMMAFYAARSQGASLTPAAMLLKLGLWP